MRWKCSPPACGAGAGAGLPALRRAGVAGDAVPGAGRVPRAAPLTEAPESSVGARQLDGHRAAGGAPARWRWRSCGARRQLLRPRAGAVAPCLFGPRAPAQRDRRHGGFHRSCATRCSTITAARRAGACRRRVALRGGLLKQIAGWPGMSLEGRAARLLNALYLGANLMVSRAAGAAARPEPRRACSAGWAGAEALGAPLKAAGRDGAMLGGMKRRLRRPSVRAPSLARVGCATPGARADARRAASHHPLHRSATTRRCTGATSA